MKILAFRSLTPQEIQISDLDQRNAIRGDLYRMPNYPIAVVDYAIADEDVVMLRLKHSQFDLHVIVEDYEAT